MTDDRSLLSSWDSVICHPTALGLPVYYAGQTGRPGHLPRHPPRRGQRVTQPWRPTSPTNTDRSATCSRPPPSRGLGTLPPDRRPGPLLRGKWLSARRADARRRAGRGPSRRAGRVVPARPRRAGALVRVPLQRVRRPGRRAVSRPGGLADQAGVSRPAVEPGVHRAGQPAFGRPGAVLARSALLQAGPARRRGRLAPGLLVLDPHDADGPPDLLDRAGRQHDRQRRRPLCPRQPHLGPAAHHRPGRQDGGAFGRC